MSGLRMYRCLVFLACLALAGCSDPVTRKYAADEPGTDKAKRAAALSIPVFPHPKGFSEGAVHGAKVFPPGALQPCLLCHSREKAAGSVRSCYDCHELTFVHEASVFKDPAVHGPAAIQKGYRTYCTRCHGEDLRGGKAGISCSRLECHTEDSPFPHMETDMRNPKTHGPLAFRFGMAACLSCHGPGSSKTGKNSCFDCHTAAWVHRAADFRDPTAHGPAARTIEDRKKCAVCHSLGGEAGKGAPACSKEGCHVAESGFPHREGWGEGAAHGKFVVERGFDSCVTSCHAVDSGVKSELKSCHDCHAFPHPKEWKSWLSLAPEALSGSSDLEKHMELSSEIGEGCKKASCHATHVQVRKKAACFEVCHKDLGDE